MTQAVLYDYWRSSACYRLRIALGLAGIDYRKIPVDLTKGVQRSRAHLARNPQGLVPVLEIDGERFTQSLAILDYLAERHGLDLLPTDLVARAKVRALAQSIAVDLHPVCNLRVVAQIAESSDTQRAWMVRFIPPALAAFEKLLAEWGKNHFCTADVPHLADIVLMPQIYNARRWGIGIEHLPRISAAVRACEAHPAFIAAYPTAP